MKVLLVNGSPHQRGCTYTALEEVAKTLEENGIETEIFQVGNKPINGCIGCGVCPSVCPEVFEMRDDGLSHVIVDTVPAGAEDAAKDAEESCPVDAITVE